MRVDVIGKQFEVTDPILEYAESKAAKLPRYFERIQQITVRISGEDHHHTAEFAVELVIDVERHDDFVSNARDRDVYAAIDQAIHKGVRQLTDFKERLKLGNR